jgi:pilus assembly protein CpaC
MRILASIITLLAMLAASLVSAPAEAADLTLEAGTGRVVALGGNATSVFAAEPKIAEVRPASPNSLFIFGVAPGRTTVAAMDASGKPIAQYQVTVRPSSYVASETVRQSNNASPGTNLNGSGAANGVALSGQVNSPAEAERAVAIAKGLLPPNSDVNNHIAVRSPIQVNLQVKIAEMSRNLSRGFGINWQAAGTIGRYSIDAATNNLLSAVTGASSTLTGVMNGNITAMVNALAQDSLVKVLAEPNLTAMSGEAASFLVGGEFPIPVASSGTSNTVTITFKQYGISLGFVPTVLDSGRINLHVRPEVSQLTSQGAINSAIAGGVITIPGLSVRRADTTVELGSGQTFAIAGLLSDNTTDTGNALPFAGDIPVLGALFRSDEFIHNQTELVILVTPYIVRPSSEPKAVKLPTDGYTAPNDLDRILLLRQVGHGGPWDKQPVPAHIPGNAGFIVQ